MFVSKPLVSSPNETNLRLPSVSKSARRRFRSSPSPSLLSNISSGTNTTENVSALKAKYDDYAMWLRAASRRNREPMFTHELLKHSLCQMGIDSTQAEQLVSTCTWYVYQFHKELEVDSEQRQQLNNDENKKSSSTNKKRSKKVRSGKTKRQNHPRDLSAESTGTLTNSMSKENLVASGSTPPSRSKYSVLPSIHSTNDSSVSPRSRRVDFDNEPVISSSSTNRKSSHWRSAMTKVRHLPKLRPSDVDSSTTITLDAPSETNLLENDLSTSQRNFPRPIQTRSILRKQMSTASSVASTDLNNRNQRHRLSTPASTIVDEIPLGTKSQRLFGGSECFAQIMNELEEQAI